MEADLWEFYVEVAGREVEVMLAACPQGNKYLKAATDEGDQPDTLLALPEDGPQAP